MQDRRFQWRVVRTSEAELEHALNDLDDEWEIFSVLPTINFESQFMGVPVPSEVAYTLIGRKRKQA
jgi:hypothetical protein